MPGRSASAQDLKGAGAPGQRAPGAGTPPAGATAWPQWEAFCRRFLQADGRIVDLTFERKSTSEGQSYGLFLALVANDRARFETVRKWTSDNLCAGQLGARLPAWLWGLREDGSWGVKDANSASDADLWIAYSLLEAARLWNLPAHAATARQLLALVAAREVVQAGAAGTLLLPGAVGFVLDGGRHRINPSYLPGFMFQYLAAADPSGPWQAIWDNYMRLAPQIYPMGVAPDNVIVTAQGRVLPDTEGAALGSYDAIRVYLWAALSTPSHAGGAARFAPFVAITRKAGVAPEKIDPMTAIARVSDYSPVGYAGALLPLLSVMGERGALEQQLERLRRAAAEEQRGGASNYYDQVLVLFGQGWFEGWYRFDKGGRLQPRWLR